jgi:hypothetical protein
MSLFTEPELHRFKTHLCNIIITPKFRYLANMKYTLGKFPGRTEENYNELQSGQLVSRPRFEPRASRVLPIRATKSRICLDKYINISDNSNIRQHVFIHHFRLYRLPLIKINFSRCRHVFNFQCKLRSHDKNVENTLQ